MAEPVSVAVRAPPCRSFGMALAAIVALGIAVRLAYMLTVVRNPPFADGLWYVQQARNLRHGLGYIDVFRQFAARSGHPDAAGSFPTAYWAPGYPAFLVVVQGVFGDGLRASQLFGGCVTGAATIALSGLLGRAIGGRGVGLLGALLVALSPSLIAVDGSVMSEALYVPLVLLALLLAQHARTRPSIGRWFALGVIIGLAALTRQDAFFLIVVAVVPAAVLARGDSARVIGRVGLVLVAIALVVIPWVVRNEIKVGEPTISTISGWGTLAAANCDETYHGTRLGYQAYRCLDLSSEWRMSEAQWTDRARHDGTQYALSHVSDWPVVGVARVLRVWGLWNPDQQTRFEGQQNRDVNWQRLAWITSTATLFLGVYGLWGLAREKKPIAMLVAPVVMATLTALLTFGNTRYGAAAAPALAIAAAAALRSLWARHTTPDPEPDAAAVAAPGRSR